MLDNKIIRSIINDREEVKQAINKLKAELKTLESVHDLQSKIVNELVK